MTKSTTFTGRSYSPARQTILNPSHWPVALETGHLFQNIDSTNDGRSSGSPWTSGKLDSFKLFSSRSLTMPRQKTTMGTTTVDTPCSLLTCSERGEYSAVFSFSFTRTFLSQGTEKSTIVRLFFSRLTTTTSRRLCSICCIVLTDWSHHTSTFPCLHKYYPFSSQCCNYKASKNLRNPYVDYLEKWIK